MGGTAASRMIALFLFLAIIRVSQGVSAGNHNAASHYDRNYNLQADHFTTPISKLLEDDIYDGLGANFIDGLDGRYLTNIQPNANGGEEGQSRPMKGKRRWAENSMSVWGKRSSAGQSVRSSPSLRRMWSENSMAVWGKRMNKPQLKAAFDLLASAQTHQRQDKHNVGYEFNVNRPQTSEQKLSDSVNSQLKRRRWAENSMSVWGKRISSPQNIIDDDSSENSDNAALAERELAANSHSSVNTHPEQDRLLKILNRKQWEPKRNWATNTMNVWGKRSNQEDVESQTRDYVEGMISDRSDV